MKIDTIVNRVGDNIGPCVLVANMYAKVDEVFLALGLWSNYVKEGGAMVIVAEVPEGHVTHYVYGR